MTRGTYSLLIHISNRVEIKVGALGTLPLPEGYYVYTGSAFGPGGFSRIERHRDNFQHGVDSSHWHIDYLAQAPETQLTAVYVSPGRDIECAVNRDLGGDPVDGFGSSDC
ncbi:MAG: GIY-YIG nuclease family protein, partial [Candidatus Nanohaloarchaea archaeon]|nr:GIY-YIG nuclease family protein [Candidatus Nanohaloarchaea archaeon]